MAKPEDIEADLTFEIDGSEVTPAKFRRGVNAFVGLLETLTHAVCKDDPQVEWRMKVKAGSNLIGAIAADGANLAHVEKIQTLFDRGLEMFEVRGQVPPVFTEAAVRHVRDLAALPATKPDDDTRVGLWVRQRRREITPQIWETAKASLQAGFDEVGTIEGRLSVVSERGEPHFVIYEPVWDKPVKCTVPEELLDRALELWRHRVAAHGLVHYRPDGIPTRIDAEEIEIFASDEHLPSLDDVQGILRIAS